MTSLFYMHVYRPLCLGYVSIPKTTQSRLVYSSFLYVTQTQTYQLPGHHWSCYSTTSARRLRQPTIRSTTKMAPYEEILKGKYPGKLHAKKVVQYIRSKIPDATGVIYVEAKKAKLHEDCDQEEHFR